MTKNLVNPYTDTPLPSWFEALLPVVDDPNMKELSYLQGRYYVDGVLSTETDLEGLYLSLRRETVANVRLDDSFRAHPWCPESQRDPGSGRLRELIAPDTRLVLSSSMNSDERLMLLTGRYYQFLELDEQYRADPENWGIAYHWLETHPAFWHRRTDKPTYNWKMKNGLSAVYSIVVPAVNGKPSVVVLEHGGWDDSRTVHYHDLRIDSQGNSFEEAYVDMAKNVDKHFTVEGVDRGLPL